MNKPRLLKMANLLERNANNKKGAKFNLNSYGFSPDASLPMDCRTQVCAMGLAALSGTFKRAGLRYEIDALADDLDEFPNEIVIMLGDCEGMEAAAQLFDLHDGEEMWLFHPGWYRGAVTGKRAELAVAKRIRGLVDGSIPARSWPMP